MGKALGIVALVFGIIGISFYPFIPFIPYIWTFVQIPSYIQLGIAIGASIVAIICGAIGIKKDDSRGLAIAGLVLGSVGVSLLLVIFILPIIIGLYY